MFPPLRRLAGTILASAIAGSLTASMFHPSMSGAPAAAATATEPAPAAASSRCAGSSSESLATFFDGAIPDLLRDSRVPGAVVAVLPADDGRQLPRARVLRDVRVRVRRDEQHPRDLVGVVPELVPAFGPAREGDDVALPERTVAVVHPHARAPAQHEEQLLAAVVKVVDELRPARLQLPDGGAEAHARRPRDARRADAAPVRYVVPDVGRVGHLPTVPRGGRTGTRMSRRRCALRLAAP